MTISYGHIFTHHPIDNQEKIVSDTAVQDSQQAIAVNQLRAFIERIERLEEEKKSISEDIKDVYIELRSNGFDAKAVRTIIRLRKQEDHERQEIEAIIQLYKDALGMR